MDTGPDPVTAPDPNSARPALVEQDGHCWRAWWGTGGRGEAALGQFPGCAREPRTTHTRDGPRSEGDQSLLLVR
ncbi:hypothetical protein Cde04nite_07240 [Cellulomonas denverensis]|nr:hypothetical protein Cde04nite_07240 [Cellulomonas denverensis]